MTYNLESKLLLALTVCLQLVLTKTTAAEKSDNKAYAEPHSKEEVMLFVKPEMPTSETVNEDSNRVPDFAMNDPLGVEHKSANLYGNTGMLVMITVPNLTQYERQQRWEKWVSKQKWPEHNAPQRVLMEDLSQQQTFKEKARGLMKEKYDPNGDVVVLVDETGVVRRQFGVNLNETVIFLVDSAGRIVHCESDDVEPDRISAQRLITHVRQLAETNGMPNDATAKSVSMAR